MQSTPPPSTPPPSMPPRPPRPARPAYLVVALIAGWIFGIGGVMNGCGLLRFYQEPDSSVEVHEVSEEGISGYFAEQQRASKEASAKALEEHQDRMIPLAIANVLLSALLILACARALAARRNSRSLALQAVAANIIYVIVDYFASSPVRNAIITVTSARPLPEDSQRLDPDQLAVVVAWSGRLLSGAHLVVLGLIAYALTRPQVIAFFRTPEEPPSKEV